MPAWIWVAEKIDRCCEAKKAPHTKSNEQSRTNGRNIYGIPYSEGTSMLLSFLESQKALQKVLLYIHTIACHPAGVSRGRMRSRSPFCGISILARGGLTQLGNPVIDAIGSTLLLQWK